MKEKYFIELLESIGTVEKNKPFNEKSAFVLAMLKKKVSGEQLTRMEEIKLVQCIHVSALTGKLSNFYSVSSSVAENDVCKARSKDCNSICSKCYAMASVNYRSNLKLSLLINHIILNCFDISLEAWSVLVIPSTNGKTRLESHGDVASRQASDNMAKIMMSHTWLTFGVWTKNFYFWFLTFQKYGKPDNMIFLVSSDKVNVVIELPSYIVPYVDHVFTVYDFKTVKEKGIQIQCGYHHCDGCLICYTKGNTTFYVNEILKSDTKKFKAYMGIE